MGIFSKLKFWGHKDNLDFDSLTGQDINPSLTPSTTPDNLGLQADPTGLDKDPLQTGSPSTSPDNLGLHPEPIGLDKDPLLAGSPTTPPVQPLKTPSQPLENKDLELISSKLDTIKAMLDSMDRRLANLEGPGRNKQQKNLW